MRHVAVAKHLTLAAGLADALDHRIMVQRIRQDQAIRNQLADGCNAGLVRDVTRGEQQRRLLAVQVGQFLLELHQGMMGSGDVAGAAGAGAHPGGGLDHGANDLGVLAHSEVVVGAPDHDVARPVRGMPHGVRKPARDPLKVGENPVAPLVMQAVESGRKELAVIHRKTLNGSWGWSGSGLFRAFPGLMSSRESGLGSQMGEGQFASSCAPKLDADQHAVCALCRR